MRTTNKRVVTMGMMGIAGLTAAVACAPIDPSEPGTGSAAAALNTDPARTAASASPTITRSYGASCSLWDTGVSREVVLTAFGRQGTTPTYLNSYDLYDNARANASKWIATGTVSAGGVNATAAAYVGAVAGPDADGSGHLTACYFAGGYNGTAPQTQLWKATVASGAVTWTKLHVMNTARARFGFSWGGSSTKKLIAVGGGFGTTRDGTIETYDLAGDTWTTATTSGGVTRTLDQAVHSFGFVKLSASRFIVAGGNGATDDPSAHINAIKVNANGTVDVVADIKNGGSVIGSPRKDNIVVPTGRTDFSTIFPAPTTPSEILIAMGQNNTPALVGAEKKVVIDWKTGTTAPTYAADSTGPAPTTDAVFPTVVDAYVSPKNASTNPGYIILSGHDPTGSQLAVNKIRKWTPSSSGGAWKTETTFGTSRTGVNADYNLALDHVLATGGADRFPAASSTTYTVTDLIQ
jgi:hypothetical protein